MRRATNSNVFIECFTDWEQMESGLICNELRDNMYDLFVVNRIE